ARSTGVPGVGQGLELDLVLRVEELRVFYAGAFADRLQHAQVRRAAPRPDPVCELHPAAVTDRGEQVDRAGRALQQRFEFARVDRAVRGVGYGDANDRLVRGREPEVQPCQHDDR